MKTINTQLSKLKRDDFFRFEGKKTTYVFSHRQNNYCHYYRFDDVNAWMRISKFSNRKIDVDFEF